MGIVRLKTCYLEKKKAEQAFKQKHDAEKVNALLGRFTLPSVDYTKGYQPKPRPELTGGSAVNSIEDYKIKAVMQLIERTIIR